LFACGDGVLLHLVPFGLTANYASQRLECIVEAIEHEVLGRIEEPFRAAFCNRVGQDVLQRRPEVRLPDQRNGVDTGVQQRRAEICDLLNRGIFGDEAAVGVEQQILSLCGLRSDLVEDFLHVVCRRTVGAFGPQQPIVAEADDVRPQVAEHVGARPTGRDAHTA